MKTIILILLLAPFILNASQIERMLVDQMPEIYIQMDEKDEQVAIGKTQLKMNVYPVGAIVQVLYPGTEEYVTWQVDSNQNVIKLLDTGDYVFKVKRLGYNSTKRTFKLKSQHYMEIHCSLYKDRGDRMISKKPVVYLYSDKEMQFNLKLKPSGDFIYTHPKHKPAGWEVKVSENNELSVDGKSHDYLFWESNQEVPLYDKSEGFIIGGDDVIAFLESSLSKLGLNGKEQNDFIAYWGPKLSENQFNYVHFITAQSYSDQIASYESSEKIDSEIRIFMVFHKTDQLHTVNEQSLQKFERKGLTLVEWGGGDVRDTNLNAD